MVVPFLTVWGLSILLSIVAAPIYIPTSSAQGLPFLHILVNTLVLVFLMTAVLTGVWWYHIVVWFAFPWWLVMLSTFLWTWNPYSSEYPGSPIPSFYRKGKQDQRRWVLGPRSQQDRSQSRAGTEQDCAGWADCDSHKDQCESICGGRKQSFSLKKGE